MEINDENKMKNMTESEKEHKERRGNRKRKISCSM